MLNFLHKVFQYIILLFEANKIKCQFKLNGGIEIASINTHISYGLPVWGNADNHYIERIFILQKKALRAISFSDFNAHSSPILKDLKILSVRDMFTLQIYFLMWDLDHDILPESLSSHFIKRSQIHNHQTRQVTSNKYDIKRVNTTTHGLKSFQVQGSIAINKLKDLDT